MAKKELQIEDDIIDLTELIESGNSGDRRAANAYAKAAKIQTGGDDGFESLLAQETGKETPPAEDPEEALDMPDMGGIDNLLESLDIPAQPREGAASAKAPEADLDSALDDLLGPEPASAPKEDASAVLDDLLDDLPPDDEPAQPRQQAKPEPSADIHDLDADLDDILSSFDEPAPQKKPESPPVDKAEEITADLDDILNEVAPPPPPEPEIEETLAPPPPPEPEPAPAAMEEQDQITTIDLPDITPEPAQPEEPFVEPAPAAPEPEDAPIEEAAIAAREIAEAPKTGPEPGRMPALGQDTAPAMVQAPVWSPETVASLCHNLSGVHDAATQQALQGFARELGEQSAHVEDFGAQLEQLAKRVMACESRLSAARVKIANLEKSMESTAALDDLLRDGTPLHAGFMGLIASAVSSTLQNFQMDAPGPDPEVLRRLDSLTVRVAETTERVADLEKRVDASEAPDTATDDLGKLINGLENTDARIAALEKRLQELNSEIGEKLEKRAAATASKVLQEEIARLIQDGDGI